MLKEFGKIEPEIEADQEISVEDFREEIRKRRDKLISAKEQESDYKDDYHLLNVTNEQLDKIDEGDVRMMESIKAMSTEEESEKVRERIDEFFVNANKMKKDLNAVIVNDFFSKYSQFKLEKEEESRKA